MAAPDAWARLATCACYVRHLDGEARYSLRFGAHALDCPVYRESLDPVDRRADEDFRARAEIAPPPTHSIIKARKPKTYTDQRGKDLAGAAPEGREYPPAE